jgi:hypothetical protein
MKQDQGDFDFPSLTWLDMNWAAMDDCNVAAYNRISDSWVANNRTQLSRKAFRSIPFIEIPSRQRTERAYAELSIPRPNKSDVPFAILCWGYWSSKTVSSAVCGSGLSHKRPHLLNDASSPTAGEQGVAKLLPFV